MRLLPISVAVLLAVLALALAGSAGEARSQSSTLTRLVPPRDGESHFGFTFLLFDSNDPVWGDSRPFGERIQDSIRMELAGKSPTFLTVWAPWQSPDLPHKPLVPFAAMADDVAKVRSVVGPSGLLYLDWNITQSSFENNGITTRDIEAGRLDRYIRRYARDLLAYGQPVLVRLFNGEFNGSWWWGVSPKAHYGLTTRDFVKAWRRVVDLFRAVGATNVSWAWVPNAFPQEPGLLPGVDRDLAAYWPGDAYVDWAGADFYDVGAVNWLDGPYAFAVAHRKPFFVGEFGVRHEWSSLPPSAWRPWLDAAFDYFESHPAIKAVSYFNLNNRRAATHVTWDPARDVFLYGGTVRYTPDMNDHDSRLVAGGPDVRATFSSRIASPRYRSAISTEPVASTPEASRVLSVRVSARRRTAIVYWEANLAADSFDVAVRRSSGGWQVVATRRAAETYRFTGRPRERVQVRVRPRDVYDATGAWSASARVVFPAR